MFCRFFPRVVFVLAVIANFAALGQELPASPIALTRSKIIAPITVNGSGPHAFILDLGVARPVISTELADFLHLQPMAPNGYVVVNTFACGDAIVNNAPLLRMDLSKFSTNLGMPVGGIFSGREFAPAMLLDIPNKKLTFVSADTPPLAGDSEVAQFEINPKGQPVVSVTLNGDHVVPAVVDLAFGGTLSVPEGLLRTWGLLADNAKKIAFKPAEGQMPNPDGMTMVRAGSLAVAGQEMQHPVVTAGEEPARLGLGFLRNFEVAIDFRTSMIRLRPKVKLPIKDPAIVGVGLTPATFDGAHWTLWVAAGSPADKIGIAPGATLMRIEEADASGMSYADVLKALTRPEGEKLSLTVNQSGESKTVVVVSEKLL